MKSYEDMNTPDFLLWNMAVNDDEKAFEKLFSIFYPVLYIYAKRFVEANMIREDIVQDVFVTLWENRKNMSITTSVRNYLTISVKNNCLNYLRREGLLKQYEESLVDEPAQPGDIYLLSELQELLNKALAKLPEIYRLIFEMNRLEKKTYEEIAHELQISVRTAKRYNKYVTEHLKKDLKDYLPFLLLIYPSIFH